MKFRLVPMNAIKPDELISRILVILALFPMETCWRHFKVLMSHSLMLPESSMETRRGLFLMIWMAVTMVMWPTNLPLSW